jgi:cytoskeletal protein CcmA (bactofilin family)
MKVRTNLIRFLLLLAVIILPTSTVFAQGPSGDVLLFGQNYTLEEGGELNGNVAVFGGNINVEDEAIVDGDVALIGGNFRLDGDVSGNIAVIGGNITISGTVDGDVVVVGGQVELTETALVDGDIATVGGQLERAEGSQITGSVTNNQPLEEGPEVPDVPDVPNAPDVPNPPETYYFYNPLWEGGNVLFRALAVAAIAMLLSLFFQTQFERVGSAITTQPVVASSFGLLTMVVAPLAILIMVITVILIPVAAVVLLLLPLAWLFGVIALGQEVGDRFTRAINQTWAPVLSTGFGTLLLMILSGFIGMVPCIGWIVPFLLALMGIGGVMMTWFGTRAAPGSLVAPANVPPPAASTD